MTKGALVCAIAATLLLGASPGIAQPQPPLGYLDVQSDPPSEIVLDRRPTGLSTPQHHLALVPGHHSVTLFRPNGRPSTYGFVVEAGHVTHLTIHLAAR